MEQNQNISDFSLLKNKLADNDFFRNSKLTASAFDDLKIDILSLKKGENLYRLKDPPRFIYLVIEGEIKLLKKQSFGKTASLIVKNNFFGHEDYFLNAKRTSSAFAAADSLIAGLSKENIDIILSRDNSILNNIGNSVNDLDNESKAEFEKAINELYGPAKPLHKSHSELKKETGAEPSGHPPDNNSLSAVKENTAIDVNTVCSDINKIVNSISENLSCLNDEKNKLAEAISDYETRTNKLLNEIDGLKEQEKKFIALDKEKNEALGSQSYRIIELEKEITKFKETESENLKKLESLSELDANNKNNIKNLEAELSEKNTELSKYDSNLKEKESILSGIENNLQGKELIISGLEKDLKEKSEVISKLDKDLNENLKTVSELNEVRLNLLNQKEDQDKRTEELKTELENLKKEIESQNSELAGKEEKMSGLSSELQNNKQETSRQSEKLGKAESEIVKLKELLENKDASIQNLSTKIEELQKQTDEKKADIEKKEDLIDSQSSKMSEYEESLTNLRGEVAREQQFINKFIEEIGELSASVWQKQMEIEEQNKIISEFQGKSGLMKKISDSLINKEENFKKLNYELDGERGTLQKMNNELTKIKSDAERYKNELKEKEDLIEKQDEESESLKHANSALNNFLTSLKSSYDEAIKKKEEQIAELKEKIGKMQKTSNKETSGEKSIAEIIKSQPERPGGDKSESSKDLLQTIIDKDIYSNCKLVSFSCADRYSPERSFEHLQYSAVDIINVNCSRATMDVAPAFNKFLDKIISRERNKIIVNLLSCEYMDTSILGVLINSLKKAMSFKGDLVLIWHFQREFSMLSLSKMNNIFRIFPNLRYALNNFSQERPA